MSVHKKAFHLRPLAGGQMDERSSTNKNGEVLDSNFRAHVLPP